VVTLPVVPALDVPVLVAPEPDVSVFAVPPVDVALPVVALVAPLAVAVCAAVDMLAALEDLRAASAGSWPETSTIVIRSHVATNIDSAPARTRRRIIRVLIRRACLSALPRARAASGAMGVMTVPRVRSMA
jgi:hypothetical protein